MHKNWSRVERGSGSGAGMLVDGLERAVVNR